MAMISFAFLQGLCCVALASANDGVTQASVSLHHGMGPPQLPPKQAHAQPHAQQPRMESLNHETIIEEIYKSRNGKFPELALQHHKGNLHIVKPDIPPLPHRAPEALHSPLLRRAAGGSRHSLDGKKHADGKQWNLLSQGTPHVVGAGLSVAKEVASVVESSGGIDFSAAAHGAIKRPQQTKRKGGKIITRAGPKTQFDFNLNRRYRGNVMDHGEYHESSAVCNPNQMLVGPSYAPYINSSFMTSLTAPPTTCLQNCSVTTSRIDYASYSYCGELSFLSSTEAEVFLDPSTTCYVIYNFTSPVLVTGIATAGRNDGGGPGLGSDGSWVTSFDLYYGSFNESNGTYNWSVQSGLSGNTDAVSIVSQQLTNPVKAAYFMLVGTYANSTPSTARALGIYNGSGRCCFRADLLGCPLQTTTTTSTSTTTTTTIRATVTYAQATTQSTTHVIVGITVPPVDIITTTANATTNISNNSNNSNKSGASSLRARLFFVELALMFYSFWLVQ